MKIKSSKGFLACLCIFFIFAVLSAFVISLKYFEPEIKKHALRMAWQQKEKEGRLAFQKLAGNKLSFDDKYLEFPDGSRYPYLYTLNVFDEPTSVFLTLMEDSQQGRYIVFLNYHDGVLDMNALNKEDADLLAENLNKYLLLEENEKIEKVNYFPPYEQEAINQNDENQTK